MKNNIRYIALASVVILTILSCSTKKNTGITRQWHAFTGRYNTYYNGTLAYIDASLEKEKGNKDNFTERLPLYTVGNKASRDLGKANYDVAITKSQKTIQLHSIKAKPQWTKNRRKTAKDVEWLSRKEYNPFLWRAWMLMGRSQFYKGEFDEAAATFAYMSRLYKGQPAIYGKARAWLAKCYIENKFLYEAEDVIRNMQRDSIDWRAQKEWDYTLCDYYLHTEEFDKAVPYLRKVIKHEMRAKQRAREYYLLGQIEGALGHKEEAYKAFKKVLAQHPPYELAFNARISMTEVMAQEGKGKKMISRLKRMARNRNNAEYLDQVYYAIGNIYLADKDTTNAISAYETGNKKATRAGIEKGVLLLHLGDLYWAKDKYGDARRCYGEAIGLLDKERPDYQQLSDRSKVLDELVPYTDAIELQDSLLELSVMSEEDRNAAIDRVIEALIEKEKEEEALEAEKQSAALQQKYGNNSALNKNTTPTMPVMNTGGSTVWYFYNPQVVQQGKQTFQRLWGKRENTDDWQRFNKTVVGGIGIEGGTEAELADSLETLTDEQKDSIAAEEEARQKEEERMDSAVNDPHKREYYMAQIPFTDEQKAASHGVIKDGLYHSGVIFKDKLDNLALSKKQFDRLMRDYPDYSPKDELFYHLFLLHSRRDEHDVAQIYVDSLKQGYADSKWTILLTDPYFADNARFGKQLEDSLYGATYEAFRADRFSDVYANSEVSSKRFPLGDNRDRFIFVEGLTRLNDGNPDACLEAMQKVVTDYPKSSVSEMAGMIINGVKAGRSLRSSNFDLANMWDRRNITLNEGDSIAEIGLSKERDIDFAFVFAYAPDSVDENRLLFQMARYNFTNFLVRNFDISIEDSYGMHHMVVGGFRNFDEARQYSRLLLQQQNIKQVATKARPLVISQTNLSLINSRYSYNDYDSFYVANFAPLPPVVAIDRLYEPVPSEAKKTARPADGEAPVDEREAERQAMKAEAEDPVKPILPGEDVAPGLALPVEKKPETQDSELSTQDSNNSLEIAVPTETQPTEPQGLEIQTPAETQPTETPAESTIVEAPVENTTVETPAESTIVEAPVESTTVETPTESTIVEAPVETPVEETPSEETIITVPTEEQPAETQGTEFEVPSLDREGQSGSPAESEGLEITVPTETQPAETEGLEITVPTETQPAETEGLEITVPTETQTAETEGLEITVPTETQTPEETEVFEIETQDSELSTPDSEEIIIDDDEKKESTRDLEDEYFELDGF